MLQPTAGTKNFYEDRPEKTVLLFGEKGGGKGKSWEGEEEDTEDLAYFSP